MQSYLICHDWQGSPVDEKVELQLCQQTGELLIEIDAPFHGDPQPAQPAGRLWELWEYEVVELFIAGPQQRYIELEFGPHGHYLVLKLDGERNIVQDNLPLIAYGVTHGTGRWRAQARLAADLLPPPPHRFNAYAMHGDAPRARLALHPLAGPQADFHQLSSFRPLELL